jgi:hypothetical protein
MARAKKQPKQYTVADLQAIKERLIVHRAELVGKLRRCPAEPTFRVGKITRCGTESHCDLQYPGRNSRHLYRAGSASRFCGQRTVPGGLRVGIGACPCLT